MRGRYIETRVTSHMVESAAIDVIEHARRKMELEWTEQFGEAPGPQTSWIVLHPDDQKIMDNMKMGRAFLCAYTDDPLRYLTARGEEAVTHGA